MTTSILSVRTGAYAPVLKGKKLFALGEHTDTALSLFKKHTLLMQKKLQMSLLTLIVNLASIW